jgi:hypothetical protein
MVTCVASERRSYGFALLAAVVILILFPGVHCNLNSNSSPDDFERGFVIGKAFCRAMSIAPAQRKDPRWFQPN